MDLRSTLWGYDTARGMASIVSQFSFYWTNFAPLEPYFDRLERRLFASPDEVRLIAPTHGLPVGDPATTFPRCARASPGRRRARA